ncbi:MAG: Fur family transcriptional regulator [Solirubrobacterales bacterium]
MPVEDIERRLRDAGLRATAPRVAVLRALSESDDHPRVDQLIDRVRAGGVSISTQAAYDACEALRERALASRVEFPGGPVRYDARVGDNHHHLVCSGCGLVVDADCAVDAAPCLEPRDQHGFQVDAAEVTFWGRCPDCQTSKGAKL